MIGTIEYDELLEQALHKLYFETEQDELLKEPLDMKSRMDLHLGKTQKHWEDICYLVARQPLDNKPAQALFHQSLQNAFLEGNRNVREMERRAESIGKEGMTGFMGKYVRGNDAKVEDLTKRMEKIVQLQQQKSEQKATNNAASIKKIPVTDGLATVANDFMPASKALPVSSNSNGHHKKARMEDSEGEEVSVVREGLSKDSSIQSSLGHYFQPNQQTRKPKAFQPPQKTPSVSSSAPPAKEEVTDERLTGIDPKLVEIITSEIMSKAEEVKWEQIAGLEHAKMIIRESVILPLKRPDMFTGLRTPMKGMLLFGPPGTGKTMIGKCIASQAKATFFSISASSLTSKWVGESEKLVRALFTLARIKQPSVVFIDEIDSILTQRTDGEVEGSRRMKTEFLVQFDGAGTNSEDRLLIIGATNRPQELDEAARRRLQRRLYIPLPDTAARLTILNNLLCQASHSLSQADLERVAHLTNGYSGSDMTGLCKEASMMPLRDVVNLETVRLEDIRPITLKDFEEAMTQVRASVSEKDLEGYLEWNEQFGTLNPKKDV